MGSHGTGLQLGSNSPLGMFILRQSAVLARAQTSMMLPKGLSLRDMSHATHTCVHMPLPNSFLVMPATIGSTGL